MQKCAERLISRSETALPLDGPLSDFGRRGSRDHSLIRGLDQAVIVSATISWICVKQKNAWARVPFRAISGRHSRQAPLPKFAHKRPIGVSLPLHSLFAKQSSAAVEFIRFAQLGTYNEPKTPSH